ncbi:hypothetical protein QYE76_050987 [Lolium multiflorum]|uniref:Transposase (putative) gypsy type domain-containing protein n=1 Tax=Lolium multiflorum TaxID=4521 RepID=A0AAD8WJQ9_LOLMU|nr:hypothetical protein QYE76_050987 [Lolium multiflorum]
MAAEDLDWERSKISNQDLNLMKKLGLMKKDDAIRFPSEESYPNPPMEYRVSFVDHLIRGLSAPIHDFLRGLLFVYGIQLHQLTPNSILHISIFITLCECFLGVPPNWALWKRIFLLRRNASRNATYNIGGVVICVRTDVEYFDVKFPDSVQGWRKKWLYIHEESANSVEHNIVPFDGNAKIQRRRSWDAEASEEEKKATEALMSRIRQLQNTRGEELSGVQITAYFLRIRVQPLQARKNPLWTYTGGNDANRLSSDLSAKDLEKLIRRISSLNKKDPVPSSCRVKPYSSTNPLPENHPTMSSLPPLPEDGEVEEQAVVAEDNQGSSLHESEVAGSHKSAASHEKEVESEASESTQSLPPAVSPKNKRKRDDAEASGTSKPEETDPSSQKAAYDPYLETLISSDEEEEVPTADVAARTTAGGTFMSITLGAATKLLDDMMINYSEWHTERAPQGKKVNSVEETSSLSDKIDVIMSMLVNGRSNVDPNNVPLASLVAQEENVDVNFIKNNNFNNNAYRNNSGNNYRPYPSANGNGYGNSYGNSYNNNRNVPSGLEAMLKEFISTQTAFNKSVEEKLDKIDTIASRVDRLASDVNLLKLKVMPNNDIDNKITTTANAIQVRINENIRLMAELRARWDREENEKLAKENNVAKVWTITTTSNANSSHVATPPTINGNIIGGGNVSTPSAKRTKLPEIAKTAETACDKTAEIFSNLGNNDLIAVAHNDLDFDDCHISEVIKFLQKLAKSPNASAINLAFTKHITNALIKAREEKLKLETSIPRKFLVGAGIPGVAPHHISRPSTFNVLLGSSEKPWLKEKKLRLLDITSTATPPSSPRAPLSKRARTEIIPEPTLQLSSSSNPLLDDPLIKDLLRIGTQFVGYREYASKAEEKLAEANERANTLAQQLEQSEQARKKAESDAVGARAEADKAKSDAAGVEDLRKRLHDAETSLSEHITAQSAREEAILKRLKTQSRRFVARTAQEFQLEEPVNDPLLDALSFLEVHGSEAREGIDQAKAGLSRLFPYFFPKKEEPATFLDLAKSFNSAEDLGLKMRQENMKVAVESTVALVADSRQTIDWMKLIFDNYSPIPDPPEVFPSSLAKKSSVPVNLDDSSSVDLTEELKELRVQLQSVKKQSLILMEQSRESSEKEKIALQQAQDAITDKDAAVAEADAAASRENSMLQLLTDASLDMADVGQVVPKCLEKMSKRKRNFGKYDDIVTPVAEDMMDELLRMDSEFFVKGSYAEHSTRAVNNEHLTIDNILGNS